MTLYPKVLSTYHLPTGAILHIGPQDLEQATVPICLDGEQVFRSYRIGQDPEGDIFFIYRGEKYYFQHCDPI